MKTFVAIDPSINESGICWVEDGRLVRLERVNFPTSGYLPNRVARMTNAINKLAGKLPRIVELPRIREDTPNPESIIKLTLICGGITTMATEYVRPRTWKKTTDKEVKTRRIEAQVRKEFPELSKQLDDIPEAVRHNALDAAGIALWRLGIIWEKRSQRA